MRLSFLTSWLSSGWATAWAGVACCGVVVLGAYHTLLGLSSGEVLVSGGPLPWGVWRWLVADGGLDRFRASVCGFVLWPKCSGVHRHCGDGRGWWLLQVASPPSTSQCEGMGLAS
jgi:hypothetical protein